jgi:hypothetical protein
MLLSRPQYGPERTVTLVWKRRIRIVLLGSVGLLALAYVGDSLSLRFQIPERAQFGTVRIQPYVAVPRKDGRTEFILEDGFDQTCVHSLFPHFGDSPCWILERHRSKRENI